MKNYEVRMTMLVSVTVSVEAENEEHAREQAMLKTGNDEAYYLSHYDSVWEREVVEVNECESEETGGMAAGLAANNQSKDFNRLSGEAIGKLCDATHDAMKELQGDNIAIDAVCSSELYCSLFPLSVMACNHYFKREQAKLSYLKMETGELLKELYLRMQMYFNYGECKGRDLPGIAWHMEPTGVFAIALRDCAVNMEQPFKEEPWDRPARLFAIGLNLPLLESEDPEDEGSHLAGEYDEFVTFTCEVRDPGTGESECRDIYPSPNHCNEEAIRSILGGLDLISEVNNKNK